MDVDNACELCGTKLVLHENEYFFWVECGAKHCPKCFNADAHRCFSCNRPDCYAVYLPAYWAMEIEEKS